jgi:hypothetical protein
MRRVLRPAIAGAVLSGAPSTAHALVTGGDPFAATRAAGAMVAGEDANPAALVLAAAAVHGALSLAWTAVLAAVLPRRHPVIEGTVAGLAIAALDLGIVGRRVDAIRKLPLGPQVADHVAFGVVVATALAWQDRRPCSG